MWLWGEPWGIPPLHVSFWVWKVENLILAFPTSDLGFHLHSVTLGVPYLTLASSLTISSVKAHG